MNRGFFASLSPEQQKAALAYGGEENHGDERYKWRTQVSTDYQRGYNRGKASVDGQLARYRKAVDEATERARRAESGVCGPCQNCARWSRNDACHWGYCEFPKVIGIEDSNWWGQPGDKVCTQENFGCVRFLQQTPGA